MKKITTILILLCTVFVSARAQKADGSIKGKFVDTATKQAVTDATITVTNMKDSSLVTFTLTNKQGAFEV
ncbi:MAG TPA: hypothetical protein VHM26_09690, partial [Chitinophagaceae bacterium]|nr:hypothetical protein [Chitinophagaceae bacterium]